MNNLQTLSIFVLAIALFAQTAGAAETKLGVEVTPFGAYRFGGKFDVKQSDEFYELDDSASFGVILNLPHSDKYAVRGLLFATGYKGRLQRRCGERSCR